MKRKKKILIISSLLFVLFGMFFLPIFLIPLPLQTVPYSHQILDVNGKTIGELRGKDGYRHQKIQLENIPDFLQKSFIALEDSSFYNNIGVDLSAIVRATTRNVMAGEVQEGGSTISTQLIKNLYWLNEKRTFSRKLYEAYLSIALNLRDTKQEILTSYLENIYFGYLNYGITSASHFYFGKNPANLTKAEQIALIVIPKNANLYDPLKNPKAFNRRFEIVSNYLFKNGLISKDELAEVQKERLLFQEDSANKYPYLVDFFNERLVGNIAEDGSLKRSDSFNVPETSSGGQKGQEGQSKGESKNSLSSSDSQYKEDSSLRWNDKGNGNDEGNKNDKINNFSEVFTTIDADLQDKLESISRNSILPLAWKNVGDFAVVLVDRDTMQLKALVGGKDYTGSGGQVNAALAPRQVGSTIKPFTYLLAFQNLGLTPESTISDVPTQFLTDKGYAYTPQNYSLSFKGEVTLAEALSQSINVPATKLLEKVGVKNLLDFLRNIGITTLDKDEEYYGLALTLGVGEISLYELTQSYGIFAHNGDFCHITFLENVAPDCEHKVDTKYTDMINDVLSNRYVKLGEFPLYGNLDFPDRHVAVKTGTSRNFKDNWAVGFTDHYLIGVWVGNKDGGEMKGVSGATGAGEIFKNIVYAVEGTTENVAPEMQKTVKSDYLEITSPLPQSIFQIDKSKPLSSQRIQLTFGTNISYDSVEWFVDGKPFSGDFYEISEGIKVFRVVLKKGGVEVGKSESKVEVRR